MLAFQECCREYLPFTGIIGFGMILNIFFFPDIAQTIKSIFTCFESINNSVFKAFSIFGILECYGSATTIISILLLLYVWCMACGINIRNQGVWSICRSFISVVESITGLEFDRSPYNTCIQIRIIIISDGETAHMHNLNMR